ncbi:MAG: crossover junction endodeoxyribonuclease RuvC [Nitrospinaceae bacterium]|nr:crossover junction endodeoxyribonuclease RuvC [Nitrospinaceae bacterium]
MGIDPGSHCTGFGIVEERGRHLTGVHWGSVRNTARRSFPERLKAIYDELAQAIQTFTPDAIAVEDLFFAANAKAALKLGQTRGVTLLAAVHAGTPIAEYSPLEVKQAVVGYGRADKHQVREMVTMLLHLKEKPEPFDAADALAVAICHIHSAGHPASLSTKRAP